MSLILNKQQIQQKIKRLAIQILEHNHNEAEVYLIGINNNGLGFAKMLLDAIDKIEFAKPIFHLTQVSLSPANPLGKPVEINLPLEQLENKAIIFVDDVANTGRTLFYAMKPVLIDVVPKKVEVAVLVDRKHKNFPISINYVGLSLATTLSENIDVQIRDVETMAVYLN
jgi:pyrimidine operon attenuation protein/uracil phosphoribosyltransferase|tara:strand:- start:47 stop:553 length:507 start_codon:yes stop_codon:yes gene_type:complete